MKGKIRDPFSALSHWVAALVSLIGMIILLLFSSRSPAWTVSLVVYGASLVLLFSASGIYHSVIAGPRRTEWLRKLDHAAIYILIAGTYTPMCVNAFSGFWQWGLLALIWSLALIGIVVKLVVIRAPRWLTAGVYVVMGWLSLLAVGEMLAKLGPATIAWLFTGGVIYTAGAVVYITKKMDFLPGRFGFHEVWHLFVILGAAAHFAAVLTLVRGGLA